MLELYLDFMPKQWRGLGVFKMSPVQSIFHTCELMSNMLNPTEQTCNTVGFRQFIVAYNTYLHKMVILTKYNLVENLGP